CVPKSVAKPLKKTIASESIKKPRHNVRKLHDPFGKTYRWTYIKFTPSGYMWKPKSPKGNVTPNVIIPRHEKTPDHIINDRKPSVKFFHIFGSVCYIVRDGENIDKMKEKCDECIFVGYSNQSRVYRVFNKRTRVIMESIHVNFDELPKMASDQNSFDPAPECQIKALNHDSLSPAIQRQANVSQADRTALVHNSSDPAFTRQTMASVHNSSDPALTRQEMASVQNSTDPGPTCQKKASVQISSDPAPECQTMVLEHDSLSPGRNCQENVSHGDKT
nr:hypothetical protein [Tanacetum cinerariifolium]